MEIIAHRGASYDAPENTIAAVQLALLQSADAVEVDVHLSKDGHIVVIHDDNTFKTAGLKRAVCQQTQAKLKQLDAGRWKHSRWAGEKIPTLEEVVSIMPEEKPLLMEIKCGPEIVPIFAAQVGQFKRQIVPIGFCLETMGLVKSRLPHLPVYWVVKFTRDWRRGRWTPSLDYVIERAKKAGLDGLDVGANGPLTAAFARKAHEAGLKLYVWTVDSPAKARQLAKAGVDGIATNRPGWIRTKLQVQSPKSKVQS